jgi:hypothetical protein
MIDNGMQTMRARLLLARNIHACLIARGENQTALAVWCRKKSSWINKILAGKRPMHIDDFDRVADFLGIGVYQLFQPGISALTERRRRADRRKGRERRIGHAERMIVLRDSIGPREQHETTAAKSAADITAEIQALVADFAARANSLLAPPDARRQDPRTRPAEPKPRPRRKRARGPDAPNRDA